MLTHYYRFTRLILHLLRGVLAARLVFPRLDDAGRERRIRVWSQQLLGILGVRLEVRGAPVESGNTLLVSNHISWVDIFVYLALRPLRFVSKAEVREWPLAGWLVSQAGTLFLERGKRSDAVRVNRHIGDVLAAGGRVGFFPEGTTSDGTVLKHFHASLLEPAVLAASTVQPAAVRYRTPDGGYCRAPAYDGDITLPQTLRAMAAEPGIVAEVIFLDPIPAAGRSRRELARLSEAAIRRALGFDGADTPPETPAGPPDAAP